MTNQVLSMLAGGAISTESTLTIFIPQQQHGATNFASLLNLLTWLVTQLCLVLAVNQVKTLQPLWGWIIGANAALHLAVFSSNSILGFFTAYEAVLIPLQILIAQWGSGSKRLRAALLFFVYTFTGSTPMLIMAIYLTSFTTVSLMVRAPAVLAAICSREEILAMWACFALSFAVKTPLFPFFIWLIFAHAEAPVEGSILLAGVVLKLATFGVISLLLYTFWEGSVGGIALGLTVCAFTLVVASLSLVQQIDIKSFIALSSVAHMGNGSMGILSLSEEGTTGAVLIGIAHGMVSPSLFLVAGGVFYGSFNTRLIYAYRGMMVLMPLTTSLIIIHLFANMAVPLSPNWIAELLILVGLSADLIPLCGVSSLNVLLSALYTLWFLNRTIFGGWSSHLRSGADLPFGETYVLLVFTFATLGIGVQGLGLTRAMGSIVWGLLAVRFCN